MQKDILFALKVCLRRKRKNMYVEHKFLFLHPFLCIKLLIKYSDYITFFNPINYITNRQTCHAVCIQLLSAFQSNLKPERPQVHLQHFQYKEENIFLYL